MGFYELNFHQWMADNNFLVEAVLNFGKFKGRKLDDPSVRWYLGWMKKELAKDPNNRGMSVTDDTGRVLRGQELYNYLQQLGQAPQQAAPVVQQQPVQKPIDPNKRTWVLAKVKIPYQGLEPGQYVGATKKKPPNNQWWDILVIGQADRAIQTAAVDNTHIAEVIESIKDPQTGKPYTSQDPGEFYAIVRHIKGSSDDNLEDNLRGQQTNSLVGKNGKPVTIPEEYMTVYNHAIADRFKDTNEAIAIRAGAGTGKTTMLKHLSSMKKPGERWLYLVFNKKNQLDADPAFPEGVDVSTTHSYLKKVLENNRIEGVQGRINFHQGQDGKIKDRIYDIVKALVPREKPFGRFRWGAINRITAIAKLGKAFALNPFEQGVENKLEEIVSKYNMDMDLSTKKYKQDRDYTPDMLRFSAELLRASVPGRLPPMMDRRLAGVMDQSDLLWVAALNADKIRWNMNPRYNVVLMDEVQDFNHCHLIMAKKLKEAGARLVGVGDENQSLYLFNGADSDAFGKLQKIIVGDKGEAMALPINFRSDPKVLDFVRENTHVKDLLADPKKDPNAGEGNSEVDQEMYLSDTAAAYKKNDRKFNQTQAVISRTNAGLAAVAMSMLKAGVEFQILGRELSRDAIKHLENVAKNYEWNSSPDDYDIAALDEMIDEYYGDVKKKWQFDIGKQDELKEIEQNTEALKAVINFLREMGVGTRGFGKDTDDYGDEEYGERPSGAGIYRDENGQEIKNGRDFIEYIKMKLGGLDPSNEHDSAKLAQKDPHKFITLTTAHKAKGLEWDQVMVINPEEFSPTRKSIRTAEAAQQERNAWFVSLTRARHSINVGASKKK